MGKFCLFKNLSFSIYKNICIAPRIYILLFICTHFTIFTSQKVETKIILPLKKEAEKLIPRKSTNFKESMQGLIVFLENNKEKIASVNKQELDIIPKDYISNIVKHIGELDSKINIPLGKSSLLDAIINSLKKPFLNKDYGKDQTFGILEYAKRLAEKIPFVSTSLTENNLLRRLNVWKEITSNFIKDGSTENKIITEFSNFFFEYKSDSMKHIISTLSALTNNYIVHTSVNSESSKLQSIENMLKEKNKLYEAFSMIANTEQNIQKTLEASKDDNQKNSLNDIAQELRKYISNMWGKILTSTNPSELINTFNMQVGTLTNQIQKKVDDIANLTDKEKDKAEQTEETKEEEPEETKSDDVTADGSTSRSSKSSTSPPSTTTTSSTEKKDSPKKTSKKDPSGGGTAMKNDLKDRLGGNEDSINQQLKNNNFDGTFDNYADGLMDDFTKSNYDNFGNYLANHEGFQALSRHGSSQLQKIPSKKQSIRPANAIDITVPQTYYSKELQKLLAHNKSSLARTS